MSHLKPPLDRTALPFSGLLAMNLRPTVSTPAVLAGTAKALPITPLAVMSHHLSLSLSVYLLQGTLILSLTHFLWHWLALSVLVD